MLLDQAPGLDEATERALINVENYVERLEAAISSLTDAPDDLTELGGSSLDGDTDEDDFDGDDDRLQQLYELVVAVGAVAYCEGKGPGTGTGLRGFLDILEILDLVTSSERLRYNDELQEQLEIHSYDVSADPSGRGRITLWRDLAGDQYHWITFRQPRGRGPVRRNWRLILHAQALGLEYCSKHGLAPGDITAAYELRKEQQKSRWESYKK
jgi:hypothetical protein